MENSSRSVKIATRALAVLFLPFALCHLSLDISTGSRAAQSQSDESQIEDIAQFSIDRIFGRELVEMFRKGISEPFGELVAVTGVHPLAALGEHLVFAQHFHARAAQFESVTLVRGG